MTARHDLLLQLEVRNAVDEEAADPVVAVIDGDLVAAPAELLRGGEAGGAGADDADRLRALAPRLRRGDPARGEGGFGDELLDRADRDGLKALLDDAIALAEPVLRADAAADLGKIVGRGRDLVGLLDPALGGELQPVRDVVRERAMHLAIGDAALRAARRLLRRRLGLELPINLGKVAAPLGRLPLARHRLLAHDELQQLLRHRPPRPRRGPRPPCRSLASHSANRRFVRAKNTSYGK